MAVCNRRNVAQNRNVREKLSEPGSVARYEARVQGLVQGVGFRPFVARLARKLGLAGYVINDGTGVFLDVEGPPPRIDEFFAGLQHEAPPLARVSRVEKHAREPAGYDAFIIKESVRPALRFALVSPDVATCDDCLSEMRDSFDRRHKYPFINCTNCGPRFTIVEDVPYDRIRTTMRQFKMCDDCSQEYKDDNDRRFHAEPIACPVCGPSVRLVNRSGTQVCGEPVARAVELLKEGAIVSVKGLGGYHLACLASSPLAVSTLRKRKCREEKPLAIMVRDLELVESLCFVLGTEEALLTSPERPIVLLKKRPNTAVAEEVAPNNKYLGVMLPYTPLHHLLLETIPALVMTSGNLTDEPISFNDEEAEIRLGSIADYFLIHDRQIFTRCDDSVVRVVGGRSQMVRRSRGYVPNPVVFPFEGPRVLAVGAELKNTFCLLKGNLAFPSHHIGDLKNLEAYEALRSGIQHFKRLLFIEPEVVAHDMHPDYLSTRYAVETGLPLVAVQHHHAHVASCMAENGLTEKVIGLSFDGTGYGPDGTVWGGEILVADYESFERVAHLATVPLPGGEAAINEPWRMAISYLRAALGDEFLSMRSPLVERIGRGKVETITRMIERGVNSIPTSSLGRLFDAVSALLGIRDFVSFEGQAAMELEMVASDESGIEPYPYRIKKEIAGRDPGSEQSERSKDGRTEQCAAGDNPRRIASSQNEGVSRGEPGSGGGGLNGLVGSQNEPKAHGVCLLDVRGMITSIAEDVVSGKPVARISRRFHETICAAVVEICSILRTDYSLRDVCMSGGVFQNALLVTLLTNSLEKAGFTVHAHKLVPPNDGGLALGQAAVACFRMSRAH